MPPLTIMIKPASGLCNMRCRYCFYADVSARRETHSYGIMQLDVLDRLLQQALSYAEGQFNLSFQGGEPTLAGKDYFRQLLRLIRHHNRRGVPVNLAIQTNGYALDEEWLAIFKEGRFLVGVSLDGTQALHDANRVDAMGLPTWEKVNGLIDMLRQHQVDYNVLCVVTQQLASRGREVMRELARHQHLQFIPCLDDFDGLSSPYSLHADSYGSFLIQAFDTYARAWQGGTPIGIRLFDNWLGMLLRQPPESCALSGRCGNYYLIEANGNVYPCDFYVLDQWCMGNIMRDNFAVLEKSPTGRRFREQSHPLPGACAACRWLPLCRNGCMRDREPLQPAGSPHRHCAAYKAFFSARISRLEALAGSVQTARMRGKPHPLI